MILVAALGNPLRQDEGVAIRIVQELEEHLGAEGKGVRLLDLGTAGMRLLEAFEEADAAIIIDCALMEREPGTMVRFTPDDVTSRRESLSVSPHTGDLLAIVELAKNLGICPDEVVFFGIEPQALGYAEGLSPLLAERLPLYCAEVLDEIRRVRR